MFSAQSVSMKSWWSFDRVLIANVMIISDMIDRKAVLDIAIGVGATVALHRM